MTRKKPKSNNQPSLTFQTYLITIDEWETSYSLSIGKDMQHETSPYWEYASLTIEGRFIHPTKLLDKTIQMTLIGSRNEDKALDNPDENYHEPLCVGKLTIRGEQRQYLGSIPQSALWGLIPPLEAGRIKYIDLNGERLRYGSALIRSINFAKFVDPEDY